MTVPISQGPMEAPAPATKAKPALNTKTKPVAKKPRSGPAKPGAKAAAHNVRPARDSAKASVARQGSKTAKILTLLKRPGGASLPELRKTTGWQAHSVRGFLSGVLKKKMGLRLHSSRRENGERVYRLATK